jgi:plastocyanin
MRTRHFFHTKNLAYAALGAVIVVMSVGVYKKWIVFPRAVSQKSLHYVTLTKDGFYPPRLTIRKGDTVRFATIKKESFWPASDSHPTHTAYPEFDPKRPLSPSETFEFTFEKEGRWGYHNHLSPGDIGDIVVASSAVSLADVDECGAGDTRVFCGRRFLEKVVSEKGIEAGFAIFKQKDILADQNACHPLAHELGKIAYRYMREKKEVPLSDETAFCSFGFWHGFMDALTRDGREGNIVRARDICMRMEERDALLARGAAVNCWHGLGLASVGDPPDLDAWGDVNRMTAKAIPFCEEVGTTEAQRSACTEGIFHSEITYMVNQQYGLSFNLAHPLAFCDAQEKYKKECYREVAPYFPNVIHPMLLADSSFLSKLDDDTHNEFIRISTAAWVRYAIATPYSIDSFVRECEVFQGSEKDACISGVLVGLFNKDEATGYIPPLTLCGVERLTKEEKQSCYSYFGATLRGLFAAEERKSMCERFPLVYRNTCL